MCAEGTDNRAPCVAFVARVKLLRDRLTGGSWCFRPVFYQASFWTCIATSWLGSVPGGSATTFTEVAEQSGITHLQHDPAQAPELRYIPTFLGGAAAADYDNDGFVDLFVTRLDDSDILYRNLGNGTFRNVSSDAGFTDSYRSNGAAWADIDNDGDQDLYVTSINTVQYHLYINDGAGKFQEQGVQRGAALKTDIIHRGFTPVFGDYDRDGYLDLYVTEWSQVMKPSHSRLLRNRGREAPGFFEDVTIAAGVSIDDLPARRSQVVFSGAFSFSAEFVDLDDDQWMDLIIAGDYHTSRLFWNNRDGTFTDGTELANVGTEENGMGSTVADFDGDGQMDWFVTSVFDASELCEDGNSCSWGITGNRLYRNEGNRTFSDKTDVSGVRDGGWGWGSSFLDFDNDGDNDLVMTGGYNGTFPAGNVSPFLDALPRLWENNNGVFDDVASSAGITEPVQGRGLLVLDYDNDGDQDIFIVNNGAAPRLYRNDGDNDNNYLQLVLVGSESNRDAIGAKITIVPDQDTPDQTAVSQLNSGSHFLGQSEKLVHFGLGNNHSSIDKLTVEWPSGNRTVYQDLPANRRFIVMERRQDEYNTDYSQNEAVDAADYTIWRDQLGDYVGVLGEGADGSQNGIIDTDDYNLWMAAFTGLTVDQILSTVPEPSCTSTTLVYSLLASSYFFSRKRRLKE